MSTNTVSNTESQEKKFPPFPPIPSCECIVQFERYGVEFKTGLTMRNDLSKIEMSYIFDAKKGNKKYSCIMSFCPFCGRGLHMVTDETWQDRLNQQKSGESGGKE